MENIIKRIDWDFNKNLSRELIRYGILTIILYYFSYLALTENIMGNVMHLLPPLIFLGLIGITFFARLAHQVENSHRTLSATCNYIHNQANNIMFAVGTFHLAIFLISYSFLEISLSQIYLIIATIIIFFVLLKASKNIPDEITQKETLFSRLALNLIIITALAKLLIS